MKNFLTHIVFLAILSSCSVLKNEKIYVGSYENDNITIHFMDSKKGKLLINDYCCPIKETRPLCF